MAAMMPTVKIAGDNVPPPTRRDKVKLSSEEPIPALISRIVSTPNNSIDTVIPKNKSQPTHIPSPYDSRWNGSTAPAKGGRGLYNLKTAITGTRKANTGSKGTSALKNPEVGIQKGVVTDTTHAARNARSTKQTLRAI